MAPIFTYANAFLRISLENGFGLHSGIHSYTQIAFPIDRRVQQFLRSRSRKGRKNESAQLPANKYYINFPA